MKRQALASLYLEGELLKLVSERAISGAMHGRPMGAEGSIAKLVWSEAEQHLGEVAGDVLGADANTGAWGRDRVVHAGPDDRRRHHPGEQEHPRPAHPRHAAGLTDRQSAAHAPGASRRSTGSPAADPRPEPADEIRGVHESDRLQRRRREAGGVALVAHHDHVLVAPGQRGDAVLAERIESPLQHVAVDHDRARDDALVLAVRLGADVHEQRATRRRRRAPPADRGGAACGAPRRGVPRVRTSSAQAGAGMRTGTLL